MNEDADNLARNRFIILNIVRISGAIFVLLALAVISRGFLGLPREAGYVLLVLGIAEFIIAPLMLAKAWRSPTEP